MEPTHTNKDGTREINMHCPIHQDSTRSASINIDKGLWFCQAGCGGGTIVDLIRRKSEWVSPGVAATNGRATSSADQPQVILSEGMIAGWHSALMSNESALQWLRERKGINQETAARFEIGYKEGRLYTIPVRAPDREIWNVRYYNPNPAPTKRKVWSEKGYGSPNRLYPIQILNDACDEVIVGEGEWDALLACQWLHDAVTRTGAADVWSAGWGEWFKDRIVYVCHDCDTKGQKANRIVGRALHRIADVRQIILPYDITPDHGKDLSDFILDYGGEAIQGLKDEAKRYKTHAPKELERVTVLDTFDARRVGDPVEVVVTVKGRKEPGYVVPKTVRLACTQDAGQKCLGCPLNAAGGEAEITVEPDDPMVLSLIESSKQDLKFTFAESYGVPGGKCGRLQQEYIDHQAVEILFARPALDYSDGTQAGSHKNIKVTSIGTHDTILNNTIIFTGALQPNPKTQGNEFQSHKLEVMETSVDRFDMTPESIEIMKRFQAKGQRPLKKLAEISRELAQHVTLIQGRPEMHALMDLTFHSALSFNFAGALIQRGWLESIILGDTGTGKSSAATRLVGHYGAGEIVSCEAASFAGVVGGLQQMGGKDWAVTWGVIPVNDRRLVVLDEISGLTTEEIAEMSDIRSSGQAKLTKIQQDVTWSRTRLLWMGNPRNATMQNYTYGVDAIKPLIGNAEDIARFDLAMAVTKLDVPSEIINQRYEPSEQQYTAEACHQLLMWCWTRQPDQIIWDDGAEEKVFDQANELGKLYTDDPPLVLASSVRLKIARLAIALAGRLFSTDARHERLIVKKSHVEDAAAFINLLYGMKTFGYRERSKQTLATRYKAETMKDEMEQYLLSRPTLAKYLQTAGTFRRQDLEEMLNITREEANAITNTLYEAGMVVKIKGDVHVQPTLHALLREGKWNK